MSLVDYASSSDDDVPDDGGEVKEEDEPHNRPQQVNPQHSHHTIPPNNERSGQLLDRQSESAPPKLPAVVEKLPDASVLLNSPTISMLSGTDHASRVAAAMAESALRKRDLNDLSSSLPRRKIPRGNLLHTKNVPDTVGGMLVPPQLKGRSNTVTEDIGKLFVRKHTEPSSN